MRTAEEEILRARDPEFFIRHVLGVEYMPLAQERIIRVVRDNRRVAISACHGIGKTYTLGNLVPWFLCTHIPSKIITTAPTARQVNQLLWGEIRRAHRMSNYPLAGEILETPNWKFRDNWFAMGYSPEKGVANLKEGQSGSSAFQGFHEENLMIVIDEATGVARNIWTQAEAMCTSANNRIVAIGNPTTKNCTFYEKFKTSTWANMKIDCFDSPNLTVNKLRNVDDLMRERDRLLKMSDEEMRLTLTRYRVLYPALLTANWVMQMAMPDEWGIESIPFQTRILGEFPDVEDDIFFPERMVEEAYGREVVETPSCRYYGLDSARFGTDKSVLTIIEGWKQIKRLEMSGQDTSYQSGLIIKEVRTATRVIDEKIMVDSTGVGGGVTDQLKQAQREGLLPKSVAIVEIHNGNKPDEESDNEEKRLKDRHRYFNKKAKMIDLLAKDIQHKLSLDARETVYLKELPTLQYSYNNKGQIVVESKEDYSARTGKPSPDSSESLAYANYGRHIKVARAVMPRITAL